MHDELTSWKTIFLTVYWSKILPSLSRQSDHLAAVRGSIAHKRSFCVLDLYAHRRYYVRPGRTYYVRAHRIAERLLTHAHEHKRKLTVPLCSAQRSAKHCISGGKAGRLIFGGGLTRIYTMNKVDIDKTHLYLRVVSSIALLYNYNSSRDKERGVTISSVAR